MGNMISTKKVAELTGLSERRVRQIAHEMGGVPPGEGQRDWLFSERKVRAWMKKPRRKPGRPKEK